jgi:hypothetical protein
MVLPGGVELLLYEPRHQSPLDLSGDAKHSRAA